MPGERVGGNVLTSYCDPGKEKVSEGRGRVLGSANLTFSSVPPEELFDDLPPKINK